MAPRSEIGVLAGVNNNFGTVNNVYHIGATPQPEPEIVDLRDVQDGLNERFPERIPQFVPVQGRPALGPSPAVRRANAISYILAALFLAGMAAALLCFLRA